jgi:DNA modification methylase
VDAAAQGDVVLDPFCGCGTAVAVAHRLKRRWMGIDITHLAINLIKRRLKDSFGIDVEAIGEPVTLPDAEALAELNP